MIQLNISMPESCLACPCFLYNQNERHDVLRCKADGRYMGEEDKKWIIHSRPNWCPIIEVDQNMPIEATVVPKKRGIHE